MRELACVGAPRTMLVVDTGEAHAPTIAIGAGVHGDEPAAPWALFSLVRDRLLDPRFAYRIWPCTNPSGALAGTRANAEGDDINRSFSRGGTTPEARAIITANRDRRFALAIDMHEDYEADGFYLFERDGDAFGLGGPVVAALDDAGLPVQALDSSFDLGTPLEALHASRLQRGRVLVDFDREREVFEGWPYSLYITRRAAERAITCESPRRRPWEQRIAAHRVAVTTAIAIVREASNSVSAGAR